MSFLVAVAFLYLVADSIPELHSLLNAFGSALEILTLYAQRPIVEKHERYAFYHPSAEAFASVICDLPYKIVNAIFFNLIVSTELRMPGIQRTLAEYENAT